MGIQTIFKRICTVIACAGAVALGAQPNIILVLVDDLGWGDMNLNSATPKAAGTPCIQMPRLAEMAQTGLVLQRHYTAAPVCAPARASLFGGMHQGVTEVIRNNNFDAALENSHTLATVLKGAGYATALVGKWGIGGGNESGGTPETAAGWPSKRGFDFFFGYHNHLAGHRHYPKEESNADPDTHCNAAPPPKRQERRAFRCRGWPKWHRRAWYCNATTRQRLCVRRPGPPCSAACTRA